MQNAKPKLNVVTGAFGFTGKYVTRLLLAKGERVLTLTGHPQRENPFGDQVTVAPFNFDDPPALVESLRGATTLFNTYWIRFPHGRVTFGQAVENSKLLIRAAEEAGIRRIVHVSIANASEDSPFPYFQGKALVERAILQSRLSYAILRPALIFGPEDVLINNIAWLLRRFPLFLVAGAGNYRLRPIFVEDLADLAVSAAQRDDNLSVDAVGPETYTFNEMVRLIADQVGSRAWIVHVTPDLALFLARLIGRMVGDVVLTRDEIEGLMANLLVTKGPSTGSTRLSDWLDRNAERVGVRYASELKRHYGSRSRHEADPHPGGSAAQS